MQLPYLYSCLKKIMFKLFRASFHGYYYDLYHLYNPAFKKIFGASAVREHNF